MDQFLQNWGAAKSLSVPPALATMDGLLSKSVCSCCLFADLLSDFDQSANSESLPCEVESLN